MNEIDLAACVDRGANLLDQCKSDWAEGIDTEKLDLAGSCDCILGQLFNGYEKGLNLLGIEDDFNYGFSLHGSPHSGEIRMWNELKQLWIEAIEMRRKGE